MKHTEKYKQKYSVYTVRITSLQHVCTYDRKDFLTPVFICISSHCRNKIRIIKYLCISF